LVCNEGCITSLAAATLQELGLYRATDLVGGYQGWSTLPFGGNPGRCDLSGYVELGNAQDTAAWLALFGEEMQYSTRFEARPLMLDYAWDRLFH
jgi:hypothetical protein